MEIGFDDLAAERCRRPGSICGNGSPDGSGADGPVFTLDGKDLGIDPHLTHEDHPAGERRRRTGRDRSSPRKAIPGGIVEHACTLGKQPLLRGMLYLMSLMHLGGGFLIRMQGSK